MSNCPVLLGQFLDTLAASRLANRNDHRILTPHIAGIGLFLANLANVLQCGTIELDYLLAHNVTLLVGHAVDVIGIFRDSIIGDFHKHRHCDTLEDHTGLTLGIFDNWKLVAHGSILLGYRSLVRVLYQKTFSCQSPLIRGISHDRHNPKGFHLRYARPTHFPHHSDRKQSFPQSVSRIPSTAHYHQLRTFYSLFLVSLFYQTFSMLSIAFLFAQISMRYDLVKRIPFAITVSARKLNLDILANDLQNRTVSVNHLNHIANHNLLHRFLPYSYIDIIPCSS